MKYMDFSIWCAYFVAFKGIEEGLKLVNKGFDYYTGYDEKTRSFPKINIDKE